MRLKVTLSLNNLFLRKEKTAESRIFDNDVLKSIHSFGLIDNGNLTRIISLFDKIKPIFAEQNQDQIHDGSFNDTSKERI